MRDIRLDVYWREIKNFNLVRYIAEEILSVLSSKSTQQTGLGV